MKNESNKIKIVLCTAKFSDNLGDGIISECTKAMFLKSSNSVDVRDLDISGRKGFIIKSDSRNLREILKNVVLKLPSFFRTIIFVILWFAFDKNKVVKAAESSLSDADILVFGGGQLILDNNLSFPLKIRTICKVATRNNVKVYFLGCGVGKKGGWISEYIFRNIFSLENIKDVYFRDLDSINEFNKRFLSTSGLAPKLSFDSAIYSNETYFKKIKIRDNVKYTIGLGVASPYELKGSAVDGLNFSFNNILNQWLSLISVLNSNGYGVSLYTNGSSEDEAFKDILFNKCNHLSVNICCRPVRPVELVHLINQFDFIISHRLHSSIIARSINVGSIGLIWDEKVKSFYSAIGAGEYSIKGDDMDKKEILRLIKKYKKNDNSETEKPEISFLKSMVIKNFKKIVGEK